MVSPVEPSHGSSNFPLGTVLVTLISVRYRILGFTSSSCVTSQQQKHFIPRNTRILMEFVSSFFLGTAAVQMLISREVGRGSRSSIFN